MQPHQIISGFSEIKSEFRRRARTNKNMHELELWFSFSDNVLWVHDYSAHEVKIILGVLNSSGNKWTIFLEFESLGERLARYLIATEKGNSIGEIFNRNNGLYGFRPFRRR